MSEVVSGGSGASDLMDQEGTPPAGPKPMLVKSSVDVIASDPVTTSPGPAVQDSTVLVSEVFGGVDSGDASAPSPAAIDSQEAVGGAEEPKENGDSLPDAPAANVEDSLEEDLAPRADSVEVSVTATSSSCSATVAHPTMAPSSSASLTGSAEATFERPVAPSNAVEMTVEDSAPVPKANTAEADAIKPGNASIVAAPTESMPSSTANVAPTATTLVEGPATGVDIAAATATENPANGAVAVTSVGPPPPHTAPSVELPCMRGKRTVDERGAHLVQGSWGMTVASHSIEGQTSPFELRLSAPKPGQPPYPTNASGVYNGFFMLQQVSGKPALKVEERQVQLSFEENSAGTHNVTGSGKNRFGIFTVTGTADADGSLELFRAYQPKPAVNKDARKRSNTAKSTQRAQRPRTGLAPLDVAATAAVVQPGPASPRSAIGGKTLLGLSNIKKPDGTAVASGQATPGRSKRATAGDWKDKADIPMNREPAEPPRKSAPKKLGGKGKGKEHMDGVPPPGVMLPNSLADGTASKHGRIRRVPSHLQEAPEEKYVRLNEEMRKCLSVLRDLTRDPSAVWFNSPVDWRTLNLLDYPKVVTNPMDFSTIKTNIETGVVTTPEDFREAVLLVFKNAILYNTKKDNVVHVAAVSAKAFFEGKYRSQIELFVEQREQREAEKEAAAATASASAAGGGGGGNRSRKSGASRSNSGSNGSSKRVSRAKSGPRPQQNGGGGGGNSGGIPGGMVPVSQMEEMQRQMKLMQETIVMLQRQTSRTEVNMHASFQMSPTASRKNEEKPMTETEKMALRNDIGELPEAKLTRVVEIIKERNSTLDEHDQEVTIDMDALDVATLRQLQRYVKSCKKRERPSATNQTIQQQHQPSPGLPDLDMDVSSLEAEALLMEDEGGSAKRNRLSSDMGLDSMSFSQSDIPTGLDPSDDEIH